MWLIWDLGKHKWVMVDCWSNPHTNKLLRLPITTPQSLTCLLLKHKHGEAGISMHIGVGQSRRRLRGG
jgi:hypothetical protein